MPLSAEVSAELGRRLRRMRDDLLAEIRARIDSPPDERPVINPGSHVSQRDDMPTGEMISHDEEHLAEHDSDELHDIDVALAKLENGGYGICDNCGREIPEARLLAYPTAVYCIECETLFEREQERRNGKLPKI